jgi:phosphoribosylformylglycinamidine synthase
VISLESNPGQYDARVDAVQKNIALITGVQEALSRYTQVIVIEGDISEEDIKKIEEWLINPVEKRPVNVKEKAFSESIRHTGKPKIVE